ncbi:MAG: prepilin peptidase [Hyphomicrobiaceae bacterium]
MFELLLWCVFPWAMAYAGSMDLVTMTIPNRISILLVAGFVALAPFAGLSAYEIAMHLAAGSIVLAIGIALFSQGWIGGGDAKIFAAASLWLGFEHLGHFIALSAIAGGFLTMGLLFFRIMPLPVMLVEQDWIARLHHRKTGVPYGIAIAAAALMVYPSTEWLQSTLG